MKKQLLAPIVLIMLSLTLDGHAQGTSESTKLKIERAGDVCAVRINDKPFTFLHLSGLRRPILYPVLGPGQTPMTRNYPMKPDVPGEAEDHPHHKSIWCGHGLINNVSFWHEEGQILVDQEQPVHIAVAADGKSGSVQFSCKYLGPDDKLVCTDKTMLTFYDLGDTRAIDWDITIQASDGALKFGDTKEGMMAIRTHPSLRIDQGALAMNSEGVTGEDIWGKPAKWVDYSGKVEGNQVGVAIFDHPENLRHPTTWHARAYGLVAANPFGLHHFLDKPEGTGDFNVAKGDAIRFRYRFVFHPGDAKEAKIGERYAAFAVTGE